ncbi:hypothetical protein K8R78_03300 [bacterium]|nr:hypothetical protein [bacterium]
MRRVLLVLVILATLLLLGCEYEPRETPYEVSWGRISVVAPNGEWRQVLADDALFLRRYYYTSLLGEFKLYYGGLGSSSESVVRDTDGEAEFLAELADLLREQIEIANNEAILENDSQPRLYTEPYLAAEYTYHDLTDGVEQFHLERLYFVDQRYWFLDAGCLAEDEAQIRLELQKMLKTLRFPDPGEKELGDNYLLDPVEELTDEMLMGMEEFPEGVDF